MGMEYCVTNVIVYINNNGGFDIIGWYNKVKSSDPSNIEGEKSIEYGNLTYHVTILLPTDSNVIHDLVVHRFRS